MDKINELISKLTLKEKAELVTGYQSWMTYPVERLNIPSIYLTDGPIGVRKKVEEESEGSLGLGGSCLATSFPTSVCIANSWNDENAYKMGKAIGEECEAYHVNVILGPALNIKRDPRCGRNFEYYSEDPLLAGKIAGSFILGVQENNVGACIKHYALNNSENYRYMGSSSVDERAAREIYLKAFEHAVKIGHPKTAMCGYQQVNGIHCSENKWLLKDMLRDQFGFDGLVMTDWGATKDRVEGIKAGIDLDMPGEILYNKRLIIESINNKTLDEKDLDEAVRNVLNLVYSFNKNKKYSKEEIEEVLKSHRQLALDIALDSAVLLKNENNILPIKPDKKMLIVGEMFEIMRYQGAGSSCMNPYEIITIKQAFDNNNVNYEYVKGYKEITDEVDEILQEQAINRAKEYDTILFFGGLTELFESEGYDREDLKIPNNQLTLLDKLTKTNDVIFVAYGGAPFEMPFANDVKAILHMFLPGQAGGEATRKLLYGETNPSGRLSETWMKQTSDIYNANDFSKHYIEKYKENIFVGYRYYQEVNDKVLFPFGYGLSYSTFEYSNLKVKHENTKIIVSIDVTNTSNIDGKEVVQLYVGRNENSKVFKASKELKGYHKVSLKAYESKTVIIEISEEDLAYFNIKTHEFVVENGDYPIYIASNINDIKAKSLITIKGYNEVDCPYSEKVNEAYKNIKNIEGITDEIFVETLENKNINEPITRPFTLETQLEDFKQTAMGRFVLKIILKVVAGKTKVPRKEKDEAKIRQIIKNRHFALALIPKNCLRSLCQSSGGILQINLALALMHLSNGHIFKAIKYIFKKEK